MEGTFQRELLIDFTAGNKTCQSQEHIVFLLKLKVLFYVNIVIMRILLRALHFDISQHARILYFYNQLFHQILFRYFLFSERNMNDDKRKNAVDVIKDSEMVQCC